MTITPTKLRDVVIITPPRFGDTRGWFSETYNAQTLANAGITADFVQDNHSFSATIGTVRGLHFQALPKAQDKLIRVTHGRIRDVAVDIRTNSPTYGHWVAVELSAQNTQQLFVPAGFLHGFATLEANTEVMYKCSDFYAPETEGSVRFDDADLAIDWGLGDTPPQLSNKDLNAPAFRDLQSPFTYNKASR